MGLFDKIFGRPKRLPAAEAWQTLTAYRPAFTSWGGELYESQLVRAAVHARANHISKLTVQVLGTAQPTLGRQLRRAPNDWQTWGQFLYRLSTILDIQNTAFVVPVLDLFGRTVGMFPVLPSRCTVVEYAGQPYLRYEFSDGQCAAVEMQRCAVLTRFQYADDYFGSSNLALTPTMELASLQDQGIAEAVRSAATFRFMARVNNFASPADLANERRRFNRENLQGEGGVLLFPNTYADIRQIESKPYVVDAAQMEAINRNVYNYFGVNEAVLQNKAFGDAWSAFYEGAVEPFAIQFSECVTNMLFSPREQAAGARIMATANRLQYMSNNEKLAVSAQMADRGIMCRDEIREIWNLPPLPDGQGRAYTIRGEYALLGEEKNADADNAEHKDL